MANVTTGRPWKIDTATAVSIVPSTQSFIVDYIIWTSASVSGQAQVQDAAGNLMWEWSQDASSITTTSFLMDFSTQPLRFNGLSVPTLVAGSLKIYTRALN